MRIVKFLLMVVSCVLLHTGISFGETPLVSDSRIKTFVYNENEVFPIKVHYGFQSNIEFAKGEEVETLSVGDNFAWQITPVDRRLFIKPLETSARTNMTVITNKRTYQFEVVSSSSDEVVDESLVYVVRFFYPESTFDGPQPMLSSKSFMAPVPEIKSPVASSSLPPSGYSPLAASPVFSGNADAQPSSFEAFNFKYTISGADGFAPLKIFDDKKSTYFKFKNNNAVVPYIFSVDEKGNETRLQFRREAEYIVVDKISPRFSLQFGGDKVLVYNELAVGGGRG